MYICGNPFHMTLCSTPTRRKYLRTVVWAILFAITCLLPLESSPSPQGLPWLDKLAHFGFSAVLGYLLFTNLRYHPVPTLLIGTSFGGLIEVAQGTLTRSRSAEWGDLAADAVGILAGAGIAWLVVKLRDGHRPGKES